MTDVSANRIARPVTVTIAVVLVYLTALSDIGMGILVMLSRYQVPDQEVLFASLLGAAVILLGLLMIALASGLSRGSRFARIGMTIYLMLSLALQIVTIVGTDVWEWTTAIGILLDTLILAALWLPPGSRYFAAVSAPESSR